MAQGYVVNTEFPSYPAGTLVTDPDLIGEILAGIYADFITPVNVVNNGSPGISVGVSQATVGLPINLFGNAFNGDDLVAADYSVDNSTWAAVTGFVNTNGFWTGFGPSYTGPQSATIWVRDHNNTSITAQCNFTVSPSPFMVALSAITASATALGEGVPPTVTPSLVGTALNLAFGIPVGGGSGAAVYDIALYGATPGTGSSGSDCTPALVAAIEAAGGQEIIIHAGDWWFNTAFTSSSGRVVIRGQGVGQTRLHFPAGGWTIAPGSTLNQVVIRDLTMWAENTSTQNPFAISITYPSASSSGYPTVLLENVWFEGYPNSGQGTSPFPQTWNRGVVLTNTWGAYIRNCGFFGPPAAAGATTSAMVEINGANDTRLDHPYQYFGQAVVVQTGYCQGLYIDQPVIVKPDYIFAQTAPTGWTGYNASYTTLDHLSLSAGGELNVLLGLTSALSVVINGFFSGCNITRNGGPASAQTLVSMTDCSNMVFQGCNFLGVGGQLDTALSFASTFNSSHCRVANCLFDTFAVGLSISGTNGTVALLGTGLDFTNVATQVVDNTSDSAANIVEFRSAASGSTLGVSGWAKTKPHLFAGPDSSAILALQGVAGGVNYVIMFGATTTNPPIIQFRGSDNYVNGTIQTKGGSLFLSAAGDQVSGNLAQFLNAIGSVNSFTFQNATAGNVPLLEFTGSDATVNGAIQTQGGILFISGNGGGAALGAYATFQPPLDSTVAVGAIVFTPASAGGAPATISQVAGDMALGASSGRLYLGLTGGGGAVYSATIGGSTTNPGSGAANKLWNNGGVVSFAGAALPAPQFVASFLASQTFGDIPGSAAIFPHFLPPTPPTPRTGLLQGDHWKAQGIFSAADFAAPSASVDSYPALQAWLLYVQAVFLSQSGTAFLSQFNRSYFTAYLPAGSYMVSQPLVVPRWVKLGGPGLILPTPYVGAQSGGSLVSGVFDGTVNAQTNYTPLVVCAAQAHLGELNLYPAGLSGSFNYRTSGVVIGKNWQAQGALTVGTAGTGYSVGQVYLLANPDPAPYSPTFITVTAVNGSGGITAATVLFAGAYSLPPASGVYNGAPGLQETAWSAAAGYDGTHAAAVFDPAVAHALLVTTQASGLGTGGASGSGASIIPTWQPDFATGGQQYFTGAVSVPSDTTAERITIHSSVQNNYSSTYGPTFNVMVSGLECVIGEIRGLGGRVGLWAINCQDLRIGILNFVDAATFAWLRYFGSIECANCVIDTCGQAFVLDQGHGAIFTYRAFFEEANIVNPLPACNVGYTGSTSPGAISIGYGSSTTAPVSCCRLTGTLNNMGGLPQSTITAKGLTGVTATQQIALVCIANATDCTLDTQASNYSQYAAGGGGPAASLLPASALYSLGVNVDPGCVLRGSLDTLLVIDGVAVQGAIVTRTSGGALPCEVDVVDTYHQTRIRSRGICTIDQNGAPTNGTSGSGAGQAAIGSQYINTANGTIYRNTGTLSSPTWTTP